ncbi:hypothetical protein H8959_017235 [Pygathrix nigripes]
MCKAQMLSLGPGASLEEEERNGPSLLIAQIHEVDLSLFPLQEWDYWRLYELSKVTQIPPQGGKHCGAYCKASRTNRPTHLPSPVLGGGGAVTTDGCDGCQTPETRPAVGLHPARESPEVRLLFKNLEPGGETPAFKRSFQAIWRKNGRIHSERLSGLEESRFRSGVEHKREVKRAGWPGSECLLPGEFPVRGGKAEKVLDESQKMGLSYAN